MCNYVVLQVDNLIAKSSFKCFLNELEQSIVCQACVTFNSSHSSCIYLYWRACFLSPQTHPHHVLLDYVIALNKSVCQKRARLCDQIWWIQCGVSHRRRLSENSAIINLHTFMLLFTCANNYLCFFLELSMFCFLQIFFSNSSVSLHFFSQTVKFW